MTRKKCLYIFLLCISFATAAFGQPGWVPWISPLAACMGYALLWKSLLYFKKNISKFAVASIWFSLVQGVHLSWMTSIEYQGVYILFTLLAICCFLGIQFGLLTYFVFKKKDLPPSIPRIFATASVWTLFEWSRLHFLCGFSWNPLGLALTSFIPSLQMVSIWGILGLSFWVILTNLLTYRCLFFKKRRAPVSFCLAAIAFPYLFGLSHFFFQKSAVLQSDPPLAVALVQTGLAPHQKTPLSGKYELYISPYIQWNRILGYLSGLKQNRLDLIVLPEAAVPFYADQTVYSLDIVKKILITELGEQVIDCLPPLELPFARQDIIKERKTYYVSNAFWAQTIANYFRSELVIGLDVKQSDINHSVKNYNSALHFIPFAKTISNSYEKRVLVPLAEYLPFRFLLPLVSSYGISDFFTHGKESKVFRGCIPLSVSICYEETFSSLIREGKTKGAELLVNVTNDAWYPHSKLPLQHFIHGRLRAVENGIPLVRSCNSGLTAAVDASGRIISSLGDIKDPAFENLSGALFVEVQRQTNKTLYSLWGNAGILSLCCIFLGTFILFKKKRGW